MSTIFQFRRGSSASWADSNPILADGEFGLDTDIYKFKVGDGVTPWNSLDFTLATVLNGAVDPTTSVGGKGDFYINTASWQIFGPKDNGTWPAGVNLIGSTGATGPAGPAGADGADGTLDYIETTMTDTLTIDPNKSYAITSSDNAVTLTLGDLLPSITNYYTVTFTEGTLFSVALNAGSTGKTIKYVDDVLPDPVSGKVYNLSILVAGPYAIASARIAS